MPLSYWYKIFSMVFRDFSFSECGDYVFRKNCRLPDHRFDKFCDKFIVCNRNDHKRNSFGLKRFVLIKTLINNIFFIRLALFKTKFIGVNFTDLHLILLYFYFRF